MMNGALLLGPLVVVGCLSSAPSASSLRMRFYQEDHVDDRPFARRGQSIYIR